MNRVFRGWRNKALTVGTPKNIEALSHVTINPRSSTGFDGLPAELRTQLIDAGFTKEIVLREADNVKTAWEYVMRGNLPLPHTSEHRRQVRNAVQLIRTDPRKTYKKERELGVGAFGVVFQAAHRKTGRKVAVKVVSSENFREVEMEIAMHSMNQHENIVEYLATYEYKKEIWMVLELMDGGSLFSVLGADAIMGDAEIAFVCKESLKGLAYLHGRNTLHRDIKSDNILIDRKGNVKLADFGFAVGLTREQTLRNSQVGTPFWMAPELIRGLDYDGKVDTWSLAITALEMAEGEPPFYAQQPLRAAFLVISSPPPELNNPEQWSPAFVHYLKSSLVHDPAKRASSSELLLHPFIEDACKKEEFSAFVGGPGAESTTTLNQSNSLKGVQL